MRCRVKTLSRGRAESLLLRTNSSEQLLPEREWLVHIRRAALSFITTLTLNVLLNISLQFLNQLVFLLKSGFEFFDPLFEDFVLLLEVLLVSCSRWLTSGPLIRFPVSNPWLIELARMLNSTLECPFAIRASIAVMDIVPLRSNQPRLAKQLIHLVVITSCPKRQQTTERHIGL